MTGAASSLRLLSKCWMRLGGVSEVSVPFVRPCCACSLLRTLPRFVPDGAALYIATDEMAPHFFDPLKSKYQVFMIDDFERFWAPGSQWHTTYTDMFGPDPEFDDTMRVSGGGVWHTVCADVLNVPPSLCGCSIL